MPPTASPPSNIRAYVHWKEPTIFASEAIECIITFKNIAEPAGRRKQNGEQPPPASAMGVTAHSRRTSMVPSGAHSRKSSVAQMKPPPLSRATSVNAASIKGAPRSRGHRSTLSLNMTSAYGLNGGGLHSANSQPGHTPTSSIVKPVHGHGRSLSIMSMGSDAISEGRTPTANTASGKRSHRSHGRSSSLQYTPTLAAPSPVTMGNPSPRQPSPLYEATTPPEESDTMGQPLHSRAARRRPGAASAGNASQSMRKSGLRKQPSAEGREVSEFNSFKFPFDSPNQSAPPSAEIAARPKLGRSPSSLHSSKRQQSPRPADSWSGAIGNLNPISRVMSETSHEGTPRSSGEFCSASNHSDETLVSELPLQQQFGRLFPKLGGHSRQASRSPQQRPAEPETLMMAYVQTMGNFTLDGSLVNVAPFEEVKRKGVQGEGGVVGVERSKRSSGLFGALSWGNIGESLGGLLGGGEMSSMAQMKTSARLKTIPLLSTPQSLLFVDLKLAPGESRSYSYRFYLPRGLPPSHKGRALKVCYHLSLGVQRPEGQVVKHVEVPFCVLGSYDARGDILGHDLISPYVLLQDAAATTRISPDAPSTNGVPKFLSDTKAKHKKTPRQGLEDFLRYTERLLETPVDSNGALLSPTSPSSPESHVPTHQGSMLDLPPATIKEAIDLAILRSNHVEANGKSSKAPSSSANRFNIARSGQPVAVLTMLRPAYRLGEAVVGTIDFTRSHPLPGMPFAAPTYSVLIELESSEHVDPSLALRSSTSIHRVTRKVYSAVRENTIFARQISFTLSIPSNAAPSFETTGVSLAWRVKVEFVTQRQVQGLGIEGTELEGELLEELGTDERGTTRIAKEKLSADTFEITVPLKVYGAVGIDAMSAQGEALVV